MIIHDQAARSAGTMQLSLHATCLVLLAVMVLSLMQPQQVEAQQTQDIPPARMEPMPDDLQGVGIDEAPNAQLPLDLMFVDESGRRVPLKTYFESGKPVILNLGYYQCPMLCGLVLNGLLESVKQLSWIPGDEYHIVTLSIDPKEQSRLARFKKEAFLNDLKRPGAELGWHFLTGDEASIRKLAETVGFKYRWVERQQQFAHPAAIIVLTPDGRVSRYLYGIQFPEQTLRLSMVEASQGKVGSTLDRVLLMCFHYDGNSGKYTLAARGLMKFAGLVTLVSIVSVLGTAFVRESYRRRDRSLPVSLNRETETPDRGDGPGVSP